MYSITKEIYFCYGHRLMQHPGKCKNLHGHSVKAAITVSASSLNQQGMVCDFADIQHPLARYIDSELDHNLLLHRDDPLIGYLVESGERFTALDEPPTAEVLARMIYQAARQAGLPVSSVTLWETASACARYSEADAPALCESGTVVV
jgi:6-pyruvoyltetrahydropterin/6-carboxytetrahydropterin synthase